MQDLQKHLEKAEKNLSRNKLDSAIEEYKAAYKLAPENYELLLTIGELSVRAGQNEEALRCYGELFDKYAANNDANKAVALFRKSLEGTPQPPGRYCKLGTLLQRLRKNDEAAAAYRAALQLLEKAGKPADLLECLWLLAVLEPENAETQVRLGEQANQMGKADVAAKAFLRAGQLLRTAEPNRALDLLRRAHELAPDRSTTVSLAQVLVDTGQDQRAVELLMPLYAESSQDPAVLEMLGTALLRRKRLAEAAEVLEALCRVKPENSDRLFELVGLYCKAGQAEKAVALLRRLKEQFFAGKGQGAFVERLDSVYQSNESARALAEFAATVFNEANQDSRYTRVLGKLFELYYQSREFPRAAEALERLIEIDPYDFQNQQRLQKLKGKLDEARFRAVSNRITSAAAVSGQRSGLGGSEESAEESDARGMQALLEDMMVQAEIFIQYSLKAKAIEKLQKIHELFPGEERHNERLYKLYEQVDYFPQGFVASPPPKSAPAAAPVAVAAAPSPAPAPGVETVSHLAKISEITHVLYRQGTPKAALHMAVSELGKYLRASRCLGVLSRPGAAPSAAVEFCSPGVPQSSGPTVIKLLGILAQCTLDAESGAVVDVNLTPDLKQVGALSALAMPLVDKEKQEQVGLIVLSQADHVRQWKPDEVYLVKAVADQAETAISHSRLRSLMKTLSVADEGTGLLGRGSYMDCLVSEVGRAKAQGTPLVVALLELDKSGQLLRQMGEAMVQKFMQQAGETLLANVRQTDLAIRYTATALAVLLGDTTLDKVRPLVEKLRKQLSAIPFPGTRIPISFSAGLSEATVRPDYDPLDIVTDVINRAESSLEQARRRGDAVVVQ